MRQFATAEEILGNIRAEMQERVNTAKLFAEVHDKLPEPQRIRLMGPIDEGLELARAVAALDFALAKLAKPPKPIRDERRTWRFYGRSVTNWPAWGG